MQTKILEIIQFLIVEINQVKGSSLPDIELISRKLLDKGYSEKDIQEAVNWIVDFIEDRQQLPEPVSGLAQQGGQIRLLTEFERNFFTKEAYGYLIQVQELGLLLPRHIEQIIEKCMMVGVEQISREEVKTLTTQILLGREFEIRGKSVFFHPGNETIH